MKIHNNKFLKIYKTTHKLHVKFLDDFFFHTLHLFPCTFHTLEMIHAHFTPVLYLSHFIHMMLHEFTYRNEKCT